MKGEPGDRDYSRDGSARKSEPAPLPAWPPGAGRVTGMTVDKKLALRYSRLMRLSGRKPSSFTRRWTQPQRFALLGLIGINVAVSLAQLLLQGYDPSIVREYLALSDQGLKAAYGWQFLSAMFLHSGPWHLIGNMLIFYLLGRDVELIIGQRHFLFLYLLGAVGGELSHLFLMPSHTILLAASGGVAAVVISYATILPELELAVLPFPSRTFRLKAKYLAFALVALALILVVTDRSGTVSHSAYLGGCAVGWIYTHLLGFGRPSYFQRARQQRRFETERIERMSPGQFLAEEIDPLLDKISREGINSLTRAERKKLAEASARLEKDPGTA